MKKRKNWIAVLIFSWFFLPDLFAQDTTAGSADAQQVETGIYLMNVYDLDINAYSFYADFYLWFKWKGDLDPMNIEFVNSVEKWGYTIEPFEEEPALTDDGYWYNGMRIEGRFYHSFELGAFPLDRHRLDIRIENIVYPIDSLVYVPSTARALVRSDFMMPGWQIEGADMTTHSNFYETDFGEGEQPAFSNFTFTLTIARPLSYFLLKLLLPLLVIIMASMGALFIHPNYLDTRIALPIGGLLTAVFLQQSYSSALPDVGYMVLMDKIYLLSYILISLIMFKVIFSGNRLAPKKTDPLAERLKKKDRRQALIFLGLYAFGILLLVLVTGGS